MIPTWKVSGLACPNDGLFRVYMPLILGYALGFPGIRQRSLGKGEIGS